MMTLRVPRRLSPAGIHRSGALVVLLATFALGGCEIKDIINDPPEIQPRLVVDGENTTLTVGQLLPSTVTVSGNNFNLSLPSATASRTLGEICGAPCVAANGLSVPKPAFTADVTVTVTLPADVRAAALVSGAVLVRMVNNFGFDPINPPGGSPGSITITVTTGTTTLATRVLQAPAETFPNGTTRDVTLTLGSATITGPIVARVTINSPASTTPVTINTNNSFSVTGTPQNMVISSATVGVTNKSVNVTSVTLDFEGIDDTIKDRVVKGALIVTIINPFSVTGTLNVSFTGATPAIPTKTINVGSSAAQRIEFTGAELRALLGNNVIMAISGLVSGPAAGVTVTPAQVLAISTKLDLTISSKSQVN